MVCSSLRLARENMTKPMLQVLIYPWLQLVTFMPSMFKYKFGVFANIPGRKFPLWYLGFPDANDEMLTTLRARNHTLLLDKATRAKFKSYLDPFTMIPDQYRQGRDYYESYREFISFRDEDTNSLEPNSILVRDAEFRRRVSLLFTDRISPLLADSADLGKLPRTYLVVCEWDGLKDEGLIFAQRLEMAKVNISMRFYETCFHAMVNMVDRFDLSKRILNDLNDFLQKNL